MQVFLICVFYVPLKVKSTPLNPPNSIKIETCFQMNVLLLGIFIAQFCDTKIWELEIENNH